MVRDGHFPTSPAKRILLNSFLFSEEWKITQKPVSVFGFSVLLILLRENALVRLHIKGVGLTTHCSGGRRESAINFDSCIEM